MEFGKTRKASLREEAGGGSQASQQSNLGKRTQPIASRLADFLEESAIRCMPRYRLGLGRLTNQQERPASYLTFPRNALSFAASFLSCCCPGQGAVLELPVNAPLRTISSSTLLHLEYLPFVWCDRQHTCHLGMRPQWLGGRGIPRVSGEKSRLRALTHVTAASAVGLDRASRKPVLPLSLSYLSLRPLSQAALSQHPHPPQPPDSFLAIFYQFTLPFDILRRAHSGVTNPRSNLSTTAAAAHSSVHTGSRL